MLYGYKDKTFNLEFLNNLKQLKHIKSSKYGFIFDDAFMTKYIGSSVLSEKQTCKVKLPNNELKFDFHVTLRI